MKVLVVGWNDKFEPVFKRWVIDDWQLGMAWRDAETAGATTTMKIGRIKDVTREDRQK